MPLDLLWKNGHLCKKNKRLRGGVSYSRNLGKVRLHALSQFGDNGPIVPLFQTNRKSSVFDFVSWKFRVEDFNIFMTSTQNVGRKNFDESIWFGLQSVMAKNTESKLWFFKISFVSQSQRVCMLKLKIIFSEKVSFSRLKFPYTSSYNHFSRLQVWSKWATKNFVWREKCSKASFLGI